MGKTVAFPSRVTDVYEGSWPSPVRWPVLCFSSFTVTSKQMNMNKQTSVCETLFYLGPLLTLLFILNFELISKKACFYFRFLVCCCFFFFCHANKTQCSWKNSLEIIFCHIIDSTVSSQLTKTWIYFVGLTKMYDSFHLAQEPWFTFFSSCKQKRKPFPFTHMYGPVTDKSGMITCKTIVVCHPSIHFVRVSSFLKNIFSLDVYSSGGCFPNDANSK